MREIVFSLHRSVGAVMVCMVLYTMVLTGSTWRHSTVAMASISMRNGLMREIEVVDEGFKGLRVL